MTAHPGLPTSRRRLILERAIDYAGLFPPAGLGMAESVANYLAYRASPDAWALGRFVVPAARLGEFEAALPGSGSFTPPIGLSVLLGPALSADLAAVEAFSAGIAGRGVLVESCEGKAASEAEVRQMLSRLPTSLERYVEIPFGPGIGGLLDLLQAAGAYAKLRTGGVTPESIPASGALAMALIALGERRLPFKATAGLHHPITGEYPLTYASGSVRARMYGYLNLMAAAGLAFSGAAVAVVERALLTLDEADLDAFDAVRPRFLHGFGSCSFREPLDELPAAGLKVVP